MESVGLMLRGEPLSVVELGNTSDDRSCPFLTKGQRLRACIFAAASIALVVTGACSWRTSTGQPSFKSDTITNFADEPMTPWMGEHDIARLYELMSKATHYREFGAGGSTVQAVGFPNILKIVSTESDGAWVDKIEKRQDTHEAIVNKRMILEHANIGRTIEWGYPSDNSQKADWPKYSDMNNSHSEFNPPFYFDLIFVDGRFRVACFLKALKTVKPDKVNTTILSMHDYVNRDYYHVVEEFAEPLDMPFPTSVDDKWVAKAHRDFFATTPGDDVLGVFKKRIHVDEKKLDLAIKKYELIPG